MMTGNGSRIAAVFDLDGTLVDTAADLASALNQTLEAFDLPPHSEDAVRGMVGGGLAKLLERGLAAHDATLDDHTQQQALGRLVDLYTGNPVEQSRLYPGAAEMLRAIRDAGVRCGICTNKPEPITRDLLTGLGLGGAFGAILGGDAGFPRKPNPGGLLYVVEALGAVPETTIMVGDTSTDLMAARAARLKGVILVSHGYSAIPATGLGADAVINHLHELVPALAPVARAQ